MYETKYMIYTLGIVAESHSEITGWKQETIN